jgi:hypothetical protein
MSDDEIAERLEPDPPTVPRRRQNRNRPEALGDWASGSDQPQQEPNTQPNNSVHGDRRHDIPPPSRRSSSTASLSTRGTGSTAQSRATVAAVAATVVNMQASQERFMTITERRFEQLAQLLSQQQALSQPPQTGSQAILHVNSMGTVVQHYHSSQPYVQAHWAQPPPSAQGQYFG